MDGMLSQEEINALLNGMNTDTDSATDTSADTITSEEVNNGNSDNSANEEFLTDIRKRYCRRDIQHKHGNSSHDIILRWSIRK